MSEIGRIEIEADTLLRRPIDPTLKMLDADFVAIDVPMEFAVAGVQIQSMLSRDQRIRHLQIAAKFVGCSGATRDSCR